LTNVALPSNGGVALASSTLNSSLSPVYAIDGNRKGVVYWNDGTSGSYPDWLEIDLNGTKAVSEVDVFSVQDNSQSPADPTESMTFSLYGLRNFEVQYWTGSAWAPVPGGTVTNNSLVWRKFTFAPLPTSKIRVFDTATADGVWTRINEVEVYASASTSPSFLVSAIPSSLTLVQGGTATSSVTVTALNGYNGVVSLAVSGCPTGATCSLTTPVTPNPAATSTLSIVASANASTGTFPLTITGTDGVFLHTTTITLTLNPPDTLTNVALASNGGVAVASSTLNSALSPAYAIDGNRKGIVYWNDGTSRAFPDWLEVDFNGIKAVSEVDVFSVQDNFQSPADPTPSMTFSLYGLRNFEVQYWTGSAWAPVPGGTVTNNSLVWRKFTFDPLATSRIRVFDTATADGVWSRINEVEVYASVSTSPNFLVSAIPSSLTLAQGGTAASPVTVTALNGYNGVVGLAVTGCPTGVTCSLTTPVTPNPAATSTLSIAASANASTGTFPVTITGTDGVLTHTATITLTVTFMNVALSSNGAVAVASSALNSNLSPAYAIDGDRKGVIYWNDGTSRTFPDWLEVDFNGTKAISEIDVFMVQDNFQSPVDPTPSMTFSLYGLRNFEVQYWTGSAWAPVPGGTVTNNSLVWRKFTFAPLTTARIRVFVTATADGVWSRINEVEAYTGN
jgi:transposase